MDELIAFVQARLDEDERMALHSGPVSWRINESGYVQHEGHVLQGLIGGSDGKPLPFADAAHIARHDPARVLREVAAKRAILADALAIPHHYEDGDPWYSCSQSIRPKWAGDDDEPDEPGSGCIDENRAGKPCDCGRDSRVRKIAARLAAVYSDHPDYRDEWKP